jgi:hypothetical protein
LHPAALKIKECPVALPNFFIIGAPKAGTTALHAALSKQPGLYLSPVKEPKYFLCDDRPPRRWGKGPGDAHSYREWVWRRDRYEALFNAAPKGWLRGNRLPFTCTTTAHKHEYAEPSLMPSS